MFKLHAIWLIFRLQVARGRAHGSCCRCAKIDYVSSNGQRILTHANARARRMFSCIPSASYFGCSWRASSHCRQAGTCDNRFIFPSNLQRSLTHAGAHARAMFKAPLEHMAARTYTYANLLLVMSALRKRCASQRCEYFLSKGVGARAYCAGARVYTEPPYGAAVRIRKRSARASIS